MISTPFIRRFLTTAQDSIPSVISGGRHIALRCNEVPLWAQPRAQWRYAEMSNRSAHKHFERTPVLPVAILVAIMLLGVLLLAAVPGVFGYELSEQGLTRFIQSLGMWGIAGSIGLMILHSFAPFPAEFLALANGMVYGTLLGALVTWTGAMLGALLAFGLARTLGRSFVQGVAGPERWEDLEHWSQRQGGITLLLSRLVPLIAFNLINYAAGLTTISWWTFTWATGLGISPLVLLLAYMGAHMSDVPLWAWAFLGILAVLTWWAWQRLKGTHAVRQGIANHRRGG
jgi:uncharacterized membrane protein YdjX (TVP38/TMEM64 family)